MEAVACRDGLRLAQQIGVQRIWLESDCQELLKLWNAGETQRSSVMTIIKEIQELSSLFLDFKFSFISRTCNKVAHVLAKQVTSDTQTGWWQFAPDCVSALLADDCNSAIDQ